MRDDFALWEGELNQSDDGVSDTFIQTLEDMMEDQLAQIDQDEVVSILADAEMYEAARRAKDGLRFLTMSEFGCVLAVMQKIPIFMFCEPGDSDSTELLSTVVNLGRRARTERRLENGARSVESEEGT